MAERKVHLIDVTLRDGGKVNGHRWTPAQAIDVVRACLRAGVPQVEVGYWRPRRQQVDGDLAPAASCPAGYLESLQEGAPGAELTLMTSVKDCTPVELRGLHRYGVGTVRMPFRVANLPGAAGYAGPARDAGLRLVVNLADVSRLSLDQLLRAVERVDRFGADGFVLADSFGSLTPATVSRIGARLRAETSVPLGFHAHDSLGLAFANSLAAIDAGFDSVDASLSGIGPDGGNLAIELILAHLRAHGRTDLLLAPLVDASAALLTPWPGSDLTTRWAYMANAALDSARHDPASWLEHPAGQIITLFDRFAR